MKDKEITITDLANYISENCEEVPFSERYDVEQKQDSIFIVLAGLPFWMPRWPELEKDISEKELDIREHLIKHCTDKSK